VSIPKKLKQEVESRWSPYDSSVDEWTPYENLKATVLSPICSSAKIGIPVKYDLAPIWGITPSNVEYARGGVQAGDYLIFYSGNGNFPYIGKVGMKTNSSKLAETLWPYHKLNRERGGWATSDIPSNLLYLDTVWYAEISTEIVQKLRFSKDTVIRGIGQVKKNRIKRLRTSVEEIIKNNTGQIRSVAIKRNSFMRNNIRRQMNKGATDEKLLSIACKANDIDSSRLSQSAKEDIIKCLKTIYPE